MNTPTDSSVTTSKPGLPVDSSAPDQCRDLGCFVAAMFNAWNAGGIPFLILRNYELLPNHVDNDVDVLISRSHLDRAERILIQAADTVGYKLHNRAEFVPVSLFFHHPATDRQLQVDLFTSLGFRVFELLPADEVLDRRIQRENYAVPQKADETIVNLLTRLLYNGYVKKKYRADILQCFAAETETVRNRLTCSLGPMWSDFLVKSVQSQQWTAIENNARAIRRALLARTMKRQPAKVISATLRDVRRLLHRWFHAPGLHIAILGPDGCGKSTVIPRITERLQFTFSPGKGLLLHWKPVVFGQSRRQSRGVVTDPHGRPSRSPVASLVFFVFHWLEFLLGTLTIIQPVKFRNGLVISDRCYYDFMVDPKRFRLKLPTGLLKFAGRLLAQPDLVLLLNAPTEILQSRKQEVSASETERQRQAFLKIVDSLPSGHVLDATRSPDEIAQDAVRIVLAHLTQRRTHAA